MVNFVVKGSSCWRTPNQPSRLELLAGSDSCDGGGGLLICALIGYQFRPLNAVERKLVGTWSLESDPQNLVTLHSNRTISHPNDRTAPTGRWSARGDHLWGVQAPPPYPQWLKRMEWRLENHREWLNPGSFDILVLTSTHMVLRRANGSKASFVRTTEDQIKE